MWSRRWLRVALIFLAASDLAVGAWAYLFPHSFYSGMPTVDMDPPYSQHLMSDVGAMFVAQGVVLVVAAIIMDSRVTRAALAGYLTFAVLHLVFHASHLAGMPAHDAIGLVIALALDVAFPALILVTAGTAKRPV
jgi:hypothetical protein